MTDGATPLTEEEETAEFWKTHCNDCGHDLHAMNVCSAITGGDQNGPDYCPCAIDYPALAAAYQKATLDAAQDSRPVGEGRLDGHGGIVDRCRQHIAALGADLSTIKVPMATSTQRDEAADRAYAHLRAIDEILTASLQAGPAPVRPVEREGLMDVTREGHVHDVIRHTHNGTSHDHFPEREAWLAVEARRDAEDAALASAQPTPGEARQPR